MWVLVLNCGSSNLKFRIVDIRDETLTIMLSRMVNRIGEAATFTLAVDRVREAPRDRQILDHCQAVQWVFERLGGMRVESVGGANFQQSVRIDATVLAEIEQLGELAPLHNPACLAVITAAQRVLGLDVPMVAVFDTAFHHTMLERAATYAIPQDLAAQYGIRRYGFHGIAHASLYRS